MRKPRHIIDYGPGGLLLEWEQRIDPAINTSVHAYRSRIAKWPEVIDCVPSYASLLLTFAPITGLRPALRERLYRLRVSGIIDDHIPSLHRLPVAYGEAFGPDLARVADHCGIAESAVIRLHSDVTYRVYQLGYQPGFAFLGITDRELDVPRREIPRIRVPVGSVGLAGRQTAVYPSVCPGGWQIIGRCPLPLLDLAAGSPERVSRLHPGDEVEFIPINDATFSELQSEPHRWIP